MFRFLSLFCTWHHHHHHHQTSLNQSHKWTWSSDRWTIGHLPSSPHICVVIHLCVACLEQKYLPQTISLSVKPLLISSNLNACLGHGYVAVVSIAVIFHPRYWSVLEVLHPGMPNHHRNSCRPYCFLVVDSKKNVFIPFVFPVPRFIKNLGGVTIYWECSRI